MCRPATCSASSVLHKRFRLLSGPLPRSQKQQPSAPAASILSDPESTVNFLDKDAARDRSLSLRHAFRSCYAGVQHMLTLVSQLSLLTRHQPDLHRFLYVARKSKRTARNKFTSPEGHHTLALPLPGYGATTTLKHPPMLPQTRVSSTVTPTPISSSVVGTEVSTSNIYPAKGQPLLTRMQ